MEVISTKLRIITTEGKSIILDRRILRLTCGDKLTIRYSVKWTTEFKDTTWNWSLIAALLTCLMKIQRNDSISSSLIIRKGIHLTICRGIQVKETVSLNWVINERMKLMLILMFLKMQNWSRIVLIIAFQDHRWREAQRAVWTQ